MARDERSGPQWFRRTRHISEGARLGPAGRRALTSQRLVMSGLFLIGVGWCCGNVATPAIIADTAPPEVRGRAMGLNVSLSALASVTTPLLGGVLVEQFGPSELVIVSVAVLFPCLAVVLRLKETSPGQYAHTTGY